MDSISYDLESIVNLHKEDDKKMRKNVHRQSKEKRKENKEYEVFDCENDKIRVTLMKLCANFNTLREEIKELREEMNEKMEEKIDVVMYSNLVIKVDNIGDNLTELSRTVDYLQD